MDYNTSKNKLILPEYGRNIQNLVEYCLTIEDREHRNNFARGIITVMGNMNPHLRDISDFKHKLWDHLGVMSDFKLEIDAPYPMPEKATFYDKPRKVEYNTSGIKFRHFGLIIEKMIQKASAMEEGEKKDTLVELIMNHLKKSYLTWNKEVVSDEDIFEALRYLSGGKLAPKNDTKLSDSRDLKAKPKKKIHTQNHGHGGHSHSHTNNQNQRKRIIHNKNQSNH